MDTNPVSLDHFYKGWIDFQNTLIHIISPLTPDQLSLRAAPHLRSVGQMAGHIISARVGWFHIGLGEGNNDIKKYMELNQKIVPASELVEGFKATWMLINDSLKSWDPSNLSDELKANFRGKDYLLTRDFVIWHIIEHDLYHGGEIILTLRVHNLPVPPIGDVKPHVKEL